MKLAIVVSAAALLAASPALAGSNATGIGVARSAASARATGAIFNPSNRNTNTYSPASHNYLGQSTSQRTNVTNNVDPTGNSGYIGADNTTNVSNNNSTRYPQQAPPAFAPSAPSASGSCATALTFGGSVPGGGLSFSLPWNDHRCDVRANSVLLVTVLRVRKAAIQNACQDQEMAEALAASGIRCLVGPTVKR